ncbi:zona pellucida sperm-binding protein 3-like [Lepisosteus oculatus]|uniref:zona pellucida sperm-binding protein 3-like n=1 Tax=Lepisosteus oculatus TaxID=7918 RepID=UPI0035F523BE
MKPEAGRRPLPAYIKSVLFPPQRGRQPARPAIGGTRGVAVWCDSSRMYVRVSRLLFGFSCRPSEVTFGNCSVSRTTRHYFYFIYGLHECGTERSVVQGRLVYSNTLRYAPPSSSAPVHRFIPFLCRSSAPTTGSTTPTRLAMSPRGPGEGPSSRT